MEVNAESFKKLEQARLNKQATAGKVKALERNIERVKATLPKQQKPDREKAKQEIVKDFEQLKSLVKSAYRVKKTN